MSCSSWSCGAGRIFRFVPPVREDGPKGGEEEEVMQFTGAAVVLGLGSLPELDLRNSEVVGGNVDGDDGDLERGDML